MTVVDAELAHALHIRRQGRDAFDADPDLDRQHVVWQASTIDALLDGAYDGDLTFAELAAHGDFGLGTVQHLDGEMVALDGEFFTITSDGAVHVVPPATKTPFAVVQRFHPTIGLELDGSFTLDALTASISDRLCGHDEPIVAVRVDGRFTDVHVRSVPAQAKPYPPLTVVVAQQTTWHLPQVVGSLVGFRFPREAQGIDVAGYHLHVIADDRSAGGHLIDLVAHDPMVAIDCSSDLHLEVPEGVRVGGADTSALKGAVIRAVEGR